MDTQNTSQPVAPVAVIIPFNPTLAEALDYLDPNGKSHAPRTKGRPTSEVHAKLLKCREIVKADKAQKKSVKTAERAAIKAQKAKDKADAKLKAAQEAKEKADAALQAQTAPTQPETPSAPVSETPVIEISVPTETQTPSEVVTSETPEPVATASSEQRDW